MIIVSLLNNNRTRTTFQIKFESDKLVIKTSKVGSRTFPITRDQFDPRNSYPVIPYFRLKCRVERKICNLHMLLNVI